MMKGRREQVGRMPTPETSKPDPSSRDPMIHHSKKYSHTHRWQEAHNLGATGLCQLGEIDSFLAKTRSEFAGETPNKSSIMAGNGGKKQHGWAGKEEKESG